ncbi:MAG: DUF4435 domain-containing protein [Pseudomonas sp.]|nr:DUF4435 domain-containing protein [Pseudomonas sp.]
MDAFNYSVDAENITNLFYDKDFILYVEGDDDIPFWNSVFNLYSDFTFEIISLNGSEEIDEKIRLIMSNGLDVLVARDKDYKDIEGSLVCHDKVVYTYGYSIENSLYSKLVLKDVLFKLSKGRSRRSEDMDSDSWYEDFVSSTRQLVTIDASSHLSGAGIRVMGDNCSQFVMSKKIPIINNDKLIDYFSSINVQDIDPHYIEIVSDKINELGYPLYRHIRGHFLKTAIQAYIAYVMKRLDVRASVSYDLLYIAALGSFEKVLPMLQDESEHYRICVNNALKDFN